ncbi:17335_t:CDS:1, partial [Acaulospora morrowiae]
NKEQRNDQNIGGLLSVIKRPFSLFSKTCDRIGKRLERYHRIEEILRVIALIVNIISMTVGLIRVWLWWHPFEAMSDVMCLANFMENVNFSYDYLTCGITITDWSSATYSDCVPFEPAVGWFLIIVYSAVYTVLLVGILTLRGYAIWADGIVGSAILITLSGLQSVYSTQGLCTKFVAELMKLSPSLKQILEQQVLSHGSLINLW